MSGSWTLRDVIALAESFCDLGGIILAKGLHDWERRAVSLFQLHPDICLTNEQKHGALNT
jgi:hypothetical protein